MPIDSNIALGVKPVQLESPINQMSNVYALQNAAQSNQLNQMKMEEYKRGLAEEDQFKNALLSSKDDAGIKNAFYSLGQKGVKAYADYQKSNVESKKLGYETDKLKNDLVDAKLKQSKEFLNTVTTPEQYLAWHEANHADPVLGPALAARGVTQDTARAEIEAAMAKPGGFQELLQKSAIGLAKFTELNKPHFVNQDNVMVNGVPTSRVIQMSGLGGSASTVPGSTGATYNKPAASTVVNVDNKQESEFNKQLGGGQAKKVLDDKVKAEDAAQILATNNVAKTLLDKGMITGTGADFFVGLNKALNKAGIDFGKADAAANSQAYGGLMATNTAKIIKNFGAGTGLSDADRAYALKAAAGDINMDEKAIRRLIDINNQAAQNAIKMHNKNVSGIKTNIPLSVNPADYSAGIPEGRGTTSAKRGQQTLDDIFK